MKDLIFAGKAENLYHTLQRQNITIDKQMRNGEAIITGFSKEQIEPQDIMHINGTQYCVDEIIQRRDHAGSFINPQDKKNTFFKVKAKFQEILPQKV